MRMQIFDIIGIDKTIERVVGDLLVGLAAAENQEAVDLVVGRILEALDHRNRLVASAIHQNILAVRAVADARFDKVVRHDKKQPESEQKEQREHVVEHDAGAGRGAAHVRHFLEDIRQRESVADEKDVFQRGSHEEFGRVA